MAALDEAVLALLAEAECSEYAEFGPRIAPLAAISGSSRYAGTLLAEDIRHINDVRFLSLAELRGDTLKFKLGPAKRLLRAIEELQRQASPPAAAAAPAMAPAPIMAPPQGPESVAAHHPEAATPPVALVSGVGVGPVTTPPRFSPVQSSPVAEPAIPRHEPTRSSLEQSFNLAVAAVRAGPQSEAAVAEVVEALANMEASLGRNDPSVLAAKGVKAGLDPAIENQAEELQEVYTLWQAAVVADAAVGRDASNSIAVDTEFVVTPQLLHVGGLLQQRLVDLKAELIAAVTELLGSMMVEVFPIHVDRMELLCVQLAKLETLASEDSELVVTFRADNFTIAAILAFLAAVQIKAGRFEDAKPTLNRTLNLTLNPTRNKRSMTPYSPGEAEAMQVRVARTLAPELKIASEDYDSAKEVLSMLLQQCPGMAHYHSHCTNY